MKRLLASSGVAVLTMALLFPVLAHAQTPPAGDFYLQVTPSPLVTTLKPGLPTELELKVRNAGTVAEDLKIESRSFRVNDDSGQVSLDDTTPPDIAQWVTFSAPGFTIKPGDWYTQKVRIALPKEAGFSYSFALLISRKNNPKPTEGGRLIKGSLAVFTLVNVDRPGATRKLEISKFVATKKFYEYLPADMDLGFNNTGNSIVQPYGNIFMQRGAQDAEPISTLKVNDAKAYILPGSTRTLHPTWNDGFPAYKTTVDGSGKATTRLVWDWSKVANLRIGKYTAKLVAVYNDGKRDVPVEQEVSFWVVPWKILIGLLVVALLLLFSLWSIITKIIKLFRRKRKTPTAQPPPPTIDV